MSRIFLLRHAHSIANSKGILAGHLPNIPLSKDGLKQRDELNQRLVGVEFDQILSSPIQRCLETISIYRNDKNLVLSDYLKDVDYGDWSGKRMTALNRRKEWRRIHSTPATVRFPNGETLPEVQIRAIAGIESLIKPKSKNVLVATHADVIKVMILHALGTHLNNLNRLTINNASISILDFEDGDYHVLRVNDDTSTIKELLKKR